jgi:hypothetical protein
MSQPAQQQNPPGRQAAMEPRPDCGEESYRGHGRLQGKVAVVTGHSAGQTRAAGRAGADLRAARLRRGQLYVGSARRRHGRSSDPLTG